jgi:hypothetical protein
MALIFRPTASFLHSAIEGHTESRPAYLICGWSPDGYCLGEYSVFVNFLSKNVVVTPSLEPLMFTALYDFRCVSFYCRKNPEFLLATAYHPLVAKGETIQLDLFNGSINTPFPYETDLNKLLSV